MNGITVQVPIKRYLKKYLYAVEHIEYDTPIDPKNGGTIPLLVNILFTGKTDMSFKAPNSPRYDDTIPLVLSFRKIDRFQVTINDLRLKFFHDFLHSSFHQYIVQRVMHNYYIGIRCRENGINRRSIGVLNQSDTIKEIMEELDIWDDIDFESLKKAVYRKKIRANLPTFS